MLTSEKLRKPDTEKLVMKAYAWREQGILWDVIAERLGMKTSAIQRMYYYNLDEDFRERALAHNRRYKERMRRLAGRPRRPAVTNQIGAAPAGK